MGRDECRGQSSWRKETQEKSATQREQRGRRGNGELGAGAELGKLKVGWGQTGLWV